MKDFFGRLESFIIGCQEIVDENNKQFEYVQRPKVVYTKGRKYIKVIREESGQGQSVHCFVNIQTGDVLKAASWKAPAKHARGNIFNDDNGLNCMGPYGAAYLNK